jgi:hypothetical protein
VVDARRSGSDAGTVQVARRRVRVGADERDIEGTKTPAGKRTVHVDPVTVAALKAWRNRQREE